MLCVMSSGKMRRVSVCVSVYVCVRACAPMCVYVAIYKRPVHRLASDLRSPYCAHTSGEPEAFPARCYYFRSSHLLR